MRNLLYELVARSAYLSSNIGVRQGKILLLFSIFLNDLTEFLSHAYMCTMVSQKFVILTYFLFNDGDIEVYLLLYFLLSADDTVIFLESLRKSKCHISILSDIETAKTNIVIILKNGRGENTQFLFNN